LPFCDEIGEEDEYGYEDDEDDVSSYVVVTATPTPSVNSRSINNHRRHHAGMSRVDLF